MNIFDIQPQIEDDLYEFTSYDDEETLQEVNNYYEDEEDYYYDDSSFAEYLNSSNDF